MPIEITAFACEHECGKIYRSKNSARSHEERCFWNPMRQACASCGNQDREARVCLVGGWDLSKRTELRRDCPLWTLNHEPDEHEVEE